MWLLIVVWFLVDRPPDVYDLGQDQVRCEEVALELNVAMPYPKATRVYCVGAQ